MSVVTAIAPSLVRTDGPGCWRIRADGTPYPGLPAAIAAVRTSHPLRPDLQALAWALLPRLPGKPRTSGNLKEEGAFSRLNPLEDIILTDPWIAMNTENAVNVMWAETDKPGLDERLALMREWGVPVPAWKACGAVGGHVAFITKEPMVTGLPGQGKADRLRQRKLSLVDSYLTTAIDGDRHAGLRGMTKNPFSPRWDVVVGDLTPVTLDDILIPLQAMAKALGWKAPAKPYKGHRNKREPSPDGRNCALFDLTRWWAGDGCVKDGAAILVKAMQVNADFAEPLGYAEVASVAKSITKFMVNRYEGRGRHVPLAPEVVKARQAAAGRITATVRTSSRDELLLAALERLQAQGIAPGQREVAAEASVSLSTVKAVWAMLWDRIVNNSQNAPPLSGSSTTHAHKVPSEPFITPLSTASYSATANPDAPAEIYGPPLPPFHRLIGGDAGIHPRDMPPKARAAVAKWDRESWHREKSQAGPGAYQLDWNARQWRLLGERRAELDPLRETAANFAEQLLDGRAEVFQAVAANERLRRATLGWASRMKAEDRCRERTLAAMPAVSGPRLRTTLDGIDLAARALSTPSTEQTIADIRGRMRERMAA